MQIIDYTLAKTIAANCTTLAANIDADDTTLTFTDPVWTSGTPTIQIGAEDITLGATADGGYTWTGCTRGVGATDGAAHLAGQEAYVSGGTELISYQFNGSTYFNCIRVSGNAAFAAGISEDGTVKYKPRSSFGQQELIFPFARYQPANLKTFAVVIWLKYAEAAESEFSAEFQS